MSEDNAEEVVASKYRRLVELRTTRDESKQAAEKAESEYRQYEAELFEEMQDSPIKGALRLDLGDLGTIAFSPRETSFGRIIDADAAAKYFELRGESDEMTKPHIEKGKLNERVRELLEQGKPMPEGVDFYVNRGITISKKS